MKSGTVLHDRFRVFLVESKDPIAAYLKRVLHSTQIPELNRRRVFEIRFLVTVGNGNQLMLIAKLDVVFHHIDHPNGYIIIPNGVCNIDVHPDEIHRNVSVGMKMPSEIGIEKIAICLCHSSNCGNFICSKSSGSYS